MTSIRPVLRLAWRDVLRHKGRSLLIVALVALPVLMIAAADVLFRSSQATTGQRVSAELGAASGYVWAPSGAAPVAGGVSTQTWPTQFLALPPGQRPDGSVLYEQYSPDDPELIDPVHSPLRPAGEVRPLLPAGSTVTPWQRADLPVSADGVHYRTYSVDGVDLTAPAAGGRYTLVEGLVATGGDEVTLTQPLAELLGVGIGDALWVGSPAEQFRIVGLLDGLRGGSLSVKAVVAPFGAIPGNEGWDGPRYLVSGAAIGPEAVRQLNSAGMQVYSRDLALRPESQPAGEFDSTAAVGVTAAALLVVLAVMQVVFLSGPAFGIAARRMRRQLGLAAATGASPRQVAGVVLASGLLLGALASVAGVTIGAALGVVLQPVITRWTNIYFPEVQVRVGELALIAGIGAATSVLAAAWPAVTALRTDTIAALTRRTRPPRRPGLISLGGLVAAAIGVIVVVVAASTAFEADSDAAQIRSAAGERSWWIGGGLVLVQLGLIIGTPQLVAGFAWIGRYLPATPRMALRSAARHRGRSIGAVATILVASTGAVFGAVIVSTMTAQRTAEYQPTLREGLASGYAYYDPDTTRHVNQDQLTDMVSRLYRDAQVAGFARLVGPDDAELIPAVPRDQQCPWNSPGPGMIDYGTLQSQPTADELPDARTDPRCVGMSFSSLTPEQARTISTGYGGAANVAIGGADLRRILTGVDDPAADAALDAGTVVVLDQRYLFTDSTFAVVQRRWDPETGNPRDDHRRSVPAVLGNWALSPIVAIVPPAAVDALGGVAGYPGFMAVPGSTGLDRDLLQASGAALGLDYLNIFVERGPGSLALTELPSVWLILLIAAVLIIGTVLVVTALGVVDADDDSATYAAVGASAGLRRALSGWSALTTTGIGCLFGALAGLLAGWGVYRLVATINTNGIEADVPWGPVAALLIGLPLIAFGLAALFTRPRIQLIRRAE